MKEVFEAACLYELLFPEGLTRHVSLVSHPFTPHAVIRLSKGVRLVLESGGEVLDDLEGVHELVRVVHVHQINPLSTP